ncbi:MULTISPECIES: hemin uptake protein HemP [Chelativorans]|uniref:hemin uptake protein HemP n=1 Tax=Chelativorans TaxID=449972 RepID=UPI001FE60144|nr:MULTISPECIES: hemin uptake protein HemP [Chelativorans]
MRFLLKLIIDVKKSDHSEIAQPAPDASQALRPGALNVNAEFSLDRKPPTAKHEHELPYNAPSLRTFASEDLFRGAQEIVIAHGGSFYRLKITKQGKLILNK